MTYSACSRCKTAKEPNRDTYCKSCRAAYSKEWKTKNLARHIEKRKQYYAANKQKWRARNKLECVSYRRKREKVDPNFKARNRLRNYLYMAVIKNRKSERIRALLGCSVMEFKAHLESQFTNGMSWATYGNGQGKWSIDHIKPLSEFDLTKEQDVKRAMHYTNMRPLDDITNSTRFWVE